MNDIFCDFDGTITTEDVVDAFLERFASSKWIEIEETWKEGKISSRQCLERQLECVPPINARQMEEFISGICVDPHFVRFARKFEGRITILSDGFNYFIKNILERHDLFGIRFFTNNLVWVPGQSPRVTFPNLNPVCESGAGTCKCALTKMLVPAGPVFFVGDGRSDFCVSKMADFVLAKSSLINYCKEQSIDFTPFENFGQVEEYFSKQLLVGDKNAD